MSEVITKLTARIAELEKENVLLRKTLKVQEQQMKGGGQFAENRRLRAKIAEWEGNTVLMNGGYYHGATWIKPYLDNEG